jgi:DNA-binding winged helix-turn-helix (wHTH) protein/Tfp pilus assembly protein PilF
MVGKTYKFGPFLLIAETRQLLCQNKNIKLSFNAYDILLILIEKRGTLVSKEALLQQVWGDTFVEETNLHVHISALRRILGEKRGDNRFIETISGRGYCFVGSVEEITIDPVFRSLKKLPQKISSLAILPFTNDSSNSSMNYLSHGITESLIENLSQLHNLKVFARSAVFQYQNQNRDLQEIGFLLHADGLLTGHISLIDERLEVSAELVNVLDQSHLWGEQYNCHFEDIFKVKNEISLAVAKKLKTRLKEADAFQLNQQATSNSDAYKFYMRGRYLLTRRTKPELLKAIELLHEALKKDPNYTLAYTGIADAYLLLCIYYYASAAETIPKAKSAVERALRLDNSLSEAHTSNGFIQYRYELNWKAAEKSLKLAISINPNNATAHHRYANCLTFLGRHERALIHFNLALELDPFSPSINLSLVNAFNFSREYGKAIVHGEQFLEIEPKFEMFSCHVAMAYAKLGLYEAAFKYALRGFASVATPEIEAFIGWISAVAGQTAEAKKILKKLLLMPAADPYDIATIYAGLNENEKAIEYLEKAINAKSLSVCGMKTDPRFEFLQKEKKLDRLLGLIRLR